MQSGTISLLDRRPRSAAAAAAARAPRIIVDDQRAAGLFTPLGFLPHRSNGTDARYSTMARPQSSPLHRIPTAQISSGLFGYKTTTPHGAVDNVAAAGTGGAVVASKYGRMLQRVRVLETALGATQRERARDQERLKSMANLREALQHDINDRKQDVKIKTWAVTEAKRRTADAEETSAALGDENESLSAELAEKSQALGEAERALAEANALLQAATEQAEQTEQAAAELRAENDDLRRALREAAEAADGAATRAAAATEELEEERQRGREKVQEWERRWERAEQEERERREELLLEEHQRLQQQLQQQQQREQQQRERQEQRDREDRCRQQEQQREQQEQREAEQRRALEAMEAMQAMQAQLASLMSRVELAEGQRSQQLELVMNRIPLTLNNEGAGDQGAKGETKRAFDDQSPPNQQGAAVASRVQTDPSGFSKPAAEAVVDVEEVAGQGGTGATCDYDHEGGDYSDGATETSAEGRQGGGGGGGGGGRRGGGGEEEKARPTTTEEEARALFYEHRRVPCSPCLVVIANPEYSTITEEEARALFSEY